MALAAPAVVMLDAVLLAMWLVRRRWLAVLFSVAALGVLYSWIAAMIQLRMPSDKIPCDLKAATFNVDGFRGEEGFRSVVSEVASLMRNEEADVVCLEEFRITRDYDTLQVVRMLGMPYYATRGSVVLISRYPIAESGPVGFDAGAGNETNGALWADVETPAGRVRFFACHLQTTGVSSLEYRYAGKSGRVPFGVLVREMSAQSQLRAGQIERLVTLAEASPWPVVLAGDFNDTPSTYTYHVASGALNDTFREGGSGWGGTFRRGWGLLRLDYVFVSDGLRCGRCYMRSLPISDHKPVFAELSFTGKDE